MQLKTVGESLDALDSIKNVLNNTSEVKGRAGLALQVNKLKEATQGYSTEALKMAISQSTVNKECIKAMLAQSGLQGEVLETTVAELSQVTTTNALSVSQTGATATTVGLTTAVKGLGAQLKSLVVAHPVLAAIAAVGVVAFGAIEIYDALTISSEEAQEAAKKAQEAINESQNSLKQASSTISANKDRFLELSKGVNEFSENLSLSEEDYSEYLSISNQLAELFPSLVSGYDEQGNALLAIGENADETNQKLEDLLETERLLAKQTLIDNMDDVATGIYHEVKDAQAEIDALKEDIYELENNYKEVNIDIASSNGAITFSDDDFSKYGKAMEDALTSAGIKFTNKQAGLFTTSIQLKEAAPEQLKMAQEFYDAFLEIENEYHHASINGLEKDIQQKEKTINSAYTKMTANLQAWVEDNYDYQYLSDTSASLVDKMIPEIKWDELEEKPQSAFDYQNYVQEKIIDPLMQVPKKDRQRIDNMLEELLSFKDGDLEVLEFADELMSEFNKLNIDIDITPIIADEKEAKQKLQNSIDSIAQNGTIDFYTSSGIGVDAEEYKILNDYTKDFTTEQIELWNEATLGANSATDAINKYEEALNSTVVTSYSDIFELENTELGEINNQLDELQNAYTGLKKIMDSYNQSGTFTLDQVQEIISYGDEYLKYLMDENGNLQLNEEALNNVAIARINEMRVKALSNLMDNLDSITNEASALEYLKQQLIDTAEGYDEITESRINAWLSNTLESNITDSTRESLLASFRNQATAINEMFDNISISSIGGSSTKDAEKSAKEYVDSYMEFMKSSLETNRIDFRTYSNDVSAFLKKMFDEGKISGKEYFDYVQEQLETEKKVMDAVISAVTYRIDEEIDRLKSEQDEIQNTIDALREANDEKERALELEKARYELARLQSQRTIKLYTQDKGIIYTNDHTSIREAQENLKNLEFEEVINGLEDEKEALNNSIEELEKYKDKWNNIQKQHEINLNKMHANDILGQNWEKDVLSGRIDTLNNFANNYFNIQKAIADAAWNSANEQIKAAKAAQSAQSTYVTPDVPNETPQSNDYWVYKTLASEDNSGLASSKIGYLGGDGVIKVGEKYLVIKWKKGFTTSGEASSQIGMLGGSGVYKRYHTGLDEGYVGDKTPLSKDKRLDVLQKAGNGDLLKSNEQLSILKNDELVLTKHQGINIADTLWQKAMMPNITLPNYNWDNMVLRNNQSTTPNFSIGEIHLHEVQNVPDFAKALQKHLPNISVQYNGKH